jgi:hypothetical protein
MGELFCKVVNNEKIIINDKQAEYPFVLSVYGKNLELNGMERILSIGQNSEETKVFIFNSQPASEEQN